VDIRILLIHLVHLPYYPLPSPPHPPTPTPAEPMVQMKALVDATLKHGMLPRVLPEFKHITVGGAIMGAALESSSHMHGDFLDGCRAVELLLGNGSVIWCSRTEHADLFAALSGSYGTLALLLSAKILKRSQACAIVYLLSLHA
jgi:hypothetical protein